MVTVFAALMLAFPYYSSVFYPDSKKEVIIVNTADIQTITLEIEGMTCAACDSHVTHAAQEIDGVIKVKADHKTGVAEVKFDKTKTSKEAIIYTIDKTIVVDGKEKYTALKFVIATGATTNVPNIEGLDKIGYLTNVSLFDLEEKPESFYPYLTLGEGIKLAAITFGKDISKLSCCAS